MYYVNEFNKSSTSTEWEYAIWKIKRISEVTLPEFKWIKKIYDPANIFKVGDMFNVAPAILESNERKVVQRIFEGI